MAHAQHLLHDRRDPPAPRRGAGATSALLTAAFLAAGCAGLGPGTTARTLDAGTFQVMARQTVSATQAGTPPSYPTRRAALELGVHLGATDRIEVGGRMGSLGGRLDAKLALLRAPSPRQGLDLSVAPSGGLFNYGVDFEPGDSRGTLWTFFEAPLLLGLNLPGGSQAMVGAGPYYLYAVLNGVGVEFLGAEFLLAFSWRAAPGLRLVPGLACALLPSNDVWLDSGASAPVTLRPSTCEAGLSVLVGGD